MKHFTRTLLCLMLSAVLLFGTACSLTGNDTETETSVTETPTTESDSGLEGDTVLVSVGEHTVLLQDFNSLYDSYVSLYSMYGYDVESDETEKANLQSSILQYLVQEQVLLYQAEQQGFSENLTEEQQTELQEQIDTMLEELDTYYRSQAESEAEEDSSVDVETRINELIEEEADYYYPNENLTAEQYTQKLVEDTKTSYYTDLLKQSVIADLSVSEDEIETWYQDNITSLKESYQESVGAYKDDQENYELFGEAPVSYIPEGYSRIMHILISPEGDIDEEYSDKVSELDALVSEYGELGIANANGEDHSARLAEIVSEYNTLKAETDAMEEAYYADAKAKAEEAYAKLTSGTDFATVMEEYTQDSYFTDYDVLKIRGRLIYADDSTWSASVLEQFATLKVGEYSTVFRDEEGFHIIYYVSDEQSGEVALDLIHDDIEVTLLSELQSDEWSACVEEWMKDSSVVVNSDALTSLGITYNS